MHTRSYEKRNNLGLLQGVYVVACHRREVWGVRFMR
jgi:hypothetical protein